MKYTQLGRTGLEVSRLCLGTMTFGLQSDEQTAVEILDTAAAAGVNFFDTADVYPLGGGAGSTGRTEEILGGWLRGRRDRFVLATKCFGPTGPNPREREVSAAHILDAIDASLRRLGTDYVDLYQLSPGWGEWPEGELEQGRGNLLDEMLHALDELVRSGKTRYVGVSNWLADRVAQALGRSEALQVVRVESVQPRYNLLVREIEQDLLPLCQEEGIGVIPHNPLAGGLLTGKHRPGVPDEGTRFGLGAVGAIYRQRYWNDQAFDTIESLRSLADQAGLSLVTMSVSWLLDNPVVTAPIIGATRPDQLHESLRAVERPLDGDLLVQLDELTALYRTGDRETQTQ